MLDSIFESQITSVSLAICIMASIICGLINALVFMYKSRHSASFALTLSLLPMSVAIIIMLVNGNIGTGVAVAGAFALVRFRSVPGTAKEISAIFTSMALGLALGMGYITVAIIFLACSSVLTLILTKVDFGSVSRYEKRMRITIPESFNYEGLFDDLFEKFTSHYHLDKVRTTDMGTLFELTYTVVFKDTSVPKEFLDEIRTRNGNLNITVGDLSDKDML